MNKYEKLSAVVDNEMSLDAIDEQASEMVEKWSRYHLISDIMRNEYHLPLRSDFAQQIMQSIAEEATHQVTQPQFEHHQSKLTSLFKYLVANDSLKILWQAGLSATAAAVTIFCVQLSTQTNTLTPQVIVQENVPLLSYTMPVNLSVNTLEQAPLKSYEYPVDFNFERFQQQRLKQEQQQQESLFDFDTQTTQEDRP